MARPIPIAAAPPALKRERPIMNTRSDQSSAQVEDCGEDLFALTENCDFPLPSQAAKGVPATALQAKSAEDDNEEIAMPIPIATLVFQDGRTEPVYKPLAGHEHLFRAQSMMSSPSPFSNRVSGVHRPIQAAPTQAAGNPRTPQPTTLELPQQNKPQKQSTRRPRRVVAQKSGLLKSKSLKRSRSVAQGLAPNRKTDVENDADDKGDSTVEVTTEESHTFYIGDVDAFKEFLHCRFDELTMKPLRGIATHWVKLLEPRRLGDWGKYHEMLPSEADTPPWWPQTVIYKEPSHLKKDDLSTLAVEMMLIHREVDEMKRKGSWISKLREVAKFTVQTTSADNFSSSKGSVHSEEMKSRALEQILPSIFDVAQSYEDHIMQYSLFEGSGNVDPGRGKQHTWKPIPRPIRRTQQPKRARRRARETHGSVQGPMCENSGDETEPDDTMTRLARVPHGLTQHAAPPQLLPGPALSYSAAYTPRQSFSAEDSQSQSWRVDTPVSTSGPCTPAYSHDDAKMHRTASTPNSSFDQSLHGLHIAEDNMDLKPQTRTMFEESGMQPNNMDGYGQHMQYSAQPTAFNNQGYQSTDSFPSQDPNSFVQTGPTFVNPFSMYPAPPPMPYGQYANPMPTANGYPYDQGMYPQTPVSFPSTPMGMQLPPSDPNMSFNGLPSDYAVDPQGLHRF